MPRSIVVSGAPGTGKSSVADRLSDGLALPQLSLDLVKEALGDVLEGGDERWADAIGDAAAEVIFRLSRKFDICVVEGWWRGARRDRAMAEFDGLCNRSLPARSFA